MQCTPDQTLQDQAQQQCIAKMAKLTAFAGDEACGMGSSKSAKFECCQ